MRNIEKQKKITPSDWHSADIMAALWKKGYSFRRLSVINGYRPGCIRMALKKPWPKAERIIAETLGLPPWAIWPSRYNQLGMPNRGGPGRKPKLKIIKK